LAADVFLDWNGVNLIAAQGEMEKLTLDAAQGKVDKAQVALFFKKHSKKTSK
jgi:prophage maintenance system killer protein